jgi:hypothetical protein
MHATVPTQCVARLKPLLVESRVCLLSIFHVVTNLSEFMSTPSKYHIVLQPATGIGHDKFYHTGVWPLCDCL